MKYPIGGIQNMNGNQSMGATSGQLPSDGQLWVTLHTERELVCAALLSSSVPGGESAQVASESDAPAKAELNRAGSWDAHALQRRLYNLDDALDRITDGLYGRCRLCGAPIDGIRLLADPASTLCHTCSPHE
jgi:RNA polymerase-binding transcription factor DksA